MDANPALVFRQGIQSIAHRMKAFFPPIDNAIYGSLRVGFHHLFPFRMKAFVQHQNHIEVRKGLSKSGQSVNHNRPATKR